MNVVIYGALTIWLLDCALVTLAARSKLIAEFTKSECINENPQIVRHLNCHLNRNANNVSAYTFEVEFGEDVPKLDGTVFVGVKYGKILTNYTAVEMNYCEALHTVHNQYIMQMIVVGLRRVSNFPLDCPFKKNVRYIANGFTIDMKIFPAYMPRLGFRLDATFVMRKIKLLHAIAIGEIYRK